MESTDQDQVGLFQVHRADPRVLVVQGTQSIDVARGNLHPLWCGSDHNASSRLMLMTSSKPWSISLTLTSMPASDLALNTAIL